MDHLQLIERLLNENQWLREQLEAVLCNVFEEYGSRPATAMPQRIRRGTPVGARYADVERYEGEVASPTPPPTNPFNDINPTPFRIWADRHVGQNTVESSWEPPTHQ